MNDLINPLLYSKFILLVNDSFNSRNDLGFLNEYVELLYNLYQEFLFLYSTIIVDYNQEECIHHFISTEQCKTYLKDHLHLELNYA